MPKSAIRKLISKKEKLFYFCKAINHFPLWWNTGVQRESVLEEMNKLSLILLGERPKNLQKIYLKQFYISEL